MAGLSIGGKAAAVVAVCTVLGFAVAGVAIYQQAADLQQGEARNRLRAEAQLQAGVVARRFGEGPLLTRTNAAVLEQISAQARALPPPAEDATPTDDAAEPVAATLSPLRAQAIELLRQATLANPQFVGFSAIYEPGAFDGQDAAHAGIDALHDSSGRFIPYFAWTASGVAGSALVDYETAGAGDWYRVPRELKREVLVEPYVYPIDGKDVLMTTFTHAILREGEFVGATTVDFALDGLQAEIAKARIGRSGHVRLISPAGKILAGPDPAEQGKDYSAAHAQEMLATLARGEQYVVEADADHPYEQVFVPVKVGDAQEYFIVAAALAEDELLEGARALGRTVLIIALLLSAVLVAILILMMKRLVSRPLAASVRSVQRIAAGEFELDLDTRREDEVGQLARALAAMRDTLRGFVGDQHEMFTRHEAGAIGFRLDDSQYRGAFRDMVQGVNRLAQSHIAVQERLVEVISRYAEGDFSVRMEQLPGERARLSEAMERVRERLQAIKDAILQLGAAAARGEFEQRGDSSRFQHTFREMVEGLNTLMQTAGDGLAAVGELLSALAAGDLSRSIKRPLQGAFGRLRDDANTTAAQLASIIQRIKGAAETINTAAAEIAAGNADLSERSEQQAANLEETASSMEELTSTVAQNAENSRQARQLAVGAADVAGRAGGMMDEVVRTMGQISEASRKIEDIIAVIDGIAFQTNILALNAAVEAARAGEQGRGFAVVASEVRALAQRSADAAKEIKGLIAQSTERVDSGMALVDNAGQTMKELVGSVQRVTDIMSEIAAASDEQSSGIQQVNTTVVQMDQVTQQNAALVEQATAAARALEEQAEGLVDAVSVFRV